MRKESDPRENVWIVNTESMFTHQMRNLCIHKPSLGSPSSAGTTHSCHSRRIQTGQWSEEDKRKTSHLARDYIIRIRKGRNNDRNSKLDKVYLIPTERDGYQISYSGVSTLFLIRVNDQLLLYCSLCTSVTFGFSQTNAACEKNSKL